MTIQTICTTLIGTFCHALESTLIYLLLGVGLFFTCRLGFLQIRHFPHMFSLLKNSRNNTNNCAGISSFQALCTGLAARVGTGNLAGVAVALTLGGPGAIFWMWLTAFIGMATAFAESALAQLYKTTNHHGNYCGGPAYYIEKGLGLRWLGVLFSFFLIITYGWFFNAVQTNSIAQAMQTAFGIKPLSVGLVLLPLVGFIIFGGNRIIARITEWLVPVLAISYLLLAAWIIVTHFSAFPKVLVLIFKEAFGWQEAGAGTIGYTVSQAMYNGIKRGLFSNEAGMGSAPNTAAAATPHPPHPASQGYIQMLGVFLDTIAICSATAVIILFSGALETTTQMSGIQLTQRAFSSLIGAWGTPFVAFALFFFAFAAVLANYSYAESNLIFLKEKPKIVLFLFRLTVLGMVFYGALAEVPIIWSLADLSMGLMAITNLIALSCLSGTAIKLAQDYWRQRIAGQLPTFNSHSFPEIQHRLDPNIWDKLTPAEIVVKQ